MLAFEYRTMSIGPEVDMRRREFMFLLGCTAANRLLAHIRSQSLGKVAT